jgi:hypothetical protein
LEIIGRPSVPVRLIIEYEINNITLIKIDLKQYNSSPSTETFLLARRCSVEHKADETVWTLSLHPAPLPPGPSSSLPIIHSPVLLLEERMYQGARTGESWESS